MTAKQRSHQVPPLKSGHLLGIAGLGVDEMNALLDRSSFFADIITSPDQPDSDVGKILQGVTVVNLFFENSTRTRVSFEVAAKKLGASVLNISVSGSSVKKGETLVDTATTLNAMHPDILVVRHHAAGTPLLLSRHVGAAIINAGDGRHEHPTQALLDALTIKRSFGRIAGLKIAICGDIANSRVARSNLYLLGALGADLRFVAPSTLLPADVDKLGVPVFTDLDDGIAGADIIMMLRLQKERMQGREIPSQHEYFNLFGLDSASVDKLAGDAVIMHPGPMNRGVEIASSVADDPERSLITQQVEMGVAARMACLEALAFGLTRTDNNKDQGKH
ncbi:MAG: aspartate carbamoyltransferase catalytic subunit [Candidatus Puniceispirillaceae bacterium]